MRVIGGSAKGHRLAKPPGVVLRPTADAVKEALFNILADVTGKRFLDLFAGAGGVGIEAASRGAAKVVFVDKNRRCTETVFRNLRRCGIDEGHECLAMEVGRALRLLSQKEEQFDVVFLDPPYEEGLVEKTLQDIVRSNILSDDGCVAIQHSVREPVEEKAGVLISERERRYGDTVLTFMKFEQRRCVHGKSCGLSRFVRPHNERPSGHHQEGVEVFRQDDRPCRL
ncbi:MAG: 16S rRNA (guanine(966)-N(2))-methyltransferase RsmD [Syntrophobacterales bacterium]|nr:16S rRNA (guanine(966)-N(2))-methyltransferase RsmD [Syntrophobacterales bacterium]